MVSFEPFVSSDSFSMSTFNSKLGGAFGKVDEAIAAAGNCKIATGSYVGTGNSSGNNDNPLFAVTLNIGFVPKIVFIYNSDFSGGADANFCTVLMENLYSAVGYQNLMSFSSVPGDNANIGKITSWNTTVSFYGNKLTYVPNSSNVTYKWVALG